MNDTPRLPKGLRRLLDQLTVADKYRKFRIGNSREPEDDDEVEEFVQELARSLYAAGANPLPAEVMIQAMPTTPPFAPGPFTHTLTMSAP